MKTISLFLLLLCPAYGLYATPKVIDATCMGELRKTLTAEQKYVKDIIAAGKGWHIKFIATSEVLSAVTQKYEMQTASGEVMAGQNMRYKKTDKVEVFMDAHDIFTVSLRQKNILHTYTGPADLKVKDDMYMQLLQDTLYKLMEVVDCKPAKLDKVDVVCYNLRSDKLRSPYSRIEIYVDMATTRICKFHVELNPKYQKNIRQYTFTILEEKSITLGAEWNHISERFLTKSGALKPPYNKYRISEPDKDAKRQER